MITQLKSALCYTGILSFFFLNSKNDFIKFHAKQGKALTFLVIFSFFIPVIGFLLIAPFVFISSITACVKAWDMKKWKVPIIWKIPVFNKLLK